MAFKITVDKDECIGCGACVSVCQSMFKMVGGKSVPKKDVVDNIGCAKEAADSCPVSCIKIEKK
ncbi:MAG: ferredoxin [Candidatus Woesearchaeota archaeon]